MDITRVDNRPINDRPGLHQQRWPSEPRRRSAHFHIPLSTKKAYLLTLLVLILSVIVSMQLNDWNWFARSGSVIVVIGIILTSHQVMENYRRLRSRRAHFTNQFTHDFAEDLEKNRLANASLLEEDIWEDGVRGFYLLIAGTLIWGFGDLIGVFL